VGTAPYISGRVVTTENLHPALTAGGPRVSGVHPTPTAGTVAANLSLFPDRLPCVASQLCYQPGCNMPVANALPITLRCNVARRQIQEEQPNEATFPHLLQKKISVVGDSLSRVTLHCTPRCQPHLQRAADAGCLNPAN
jgi:hypothetical protein